MTDFKKLCKDLEKHKKKKCLCCKENNEYLCAYNMVKNYMDGDENKLLKLKAQAKGEEYWSSISLLVSEITLMVTVFTLYFTIQISIDPYNKMGTREWGALFVIAIIIACIMLLYMLVKSILFIRWREYIFVAIERIEKEIGEK